MIAIGSLLPRASVDLLLALISLDSLPCWSSTALGVLCPVGVLLGDRRLRRAFPLRTTSRADLGVLVVDALRCLEVIFCHPDWICPHCQQFPEKIVKYLLQGLRRYRQR